jgi:hypothetical protein
MFPITSVNGTVVIAPLQVPVSAGSRVDAKTKTTPVNERTTTERNLAFIGPPLQLILRKLETEIVSWATAFQWMKTTPRVTLPGLLKIGFGWPGKEWQADYQSVDVSEYRKSRSRCHAFGVIGREVTGMGMSNSEAMAIPHRMLKRWLSNGRASKFGLGLYLYSRSNPAL